MESEGRGRYVAVALSQSGSRLVMAKRYFLRPVSSATYSLLELAGDLGQQMHLNAASSFKWWAVEGRGRYVALTLSQSSSRQVNYSFWLSYFLLCFRS